MNILNIRIELNSIIRDVLKNLWAIFMAGLIAVMSIFIVTQGVYTPEYTAKSMVVVNAKHATSATISLFNISVDMSEVIARVLVEPSIQEAAAEILGEETFDGKLTSSVYAETNFVELSVTTDSPQKSYRLLTAVIEAFPQVSDSVSCSKSV